MAKMIEHLASAVNAYHNGKARGNTEWTNKHSDRVERMCKDVLPHGSGIDSGCTIDLDECGADGERIVIHTSYHHMNDSGMYDGWTEHAVICKPSFVHTIDLRITGRDRNGIKEYLYDVFRTVLTAQVHENYDSDRERYTYDVAS